MKSVIDFLIDDYERELDDFKEWGMNYDDLEYARKNIRDYVGAPQARAEKADAMVARMIEAGNRLYELAEELDDLVDEFRAYPDLVSWRTLVAEWKERER